MPKPYDNPTQMSLFGYAVMESFRYEVKFPQSDHKAPPELDPNWQLRMYTEEMGHEPPGEPDPQFQYNPRTKVGKALLGDLVASQEGL